MATGHSLAWSSSTLGPALTLIALEVTLNSTLPLGLQFLPLSAEDIGADVP